MIVAGFGFRRGATHESLREAYDKARASNHATHLATAADKAEAPAFKTLAKAVNLPTVALTPNALTDTDTPTQSPRVQAERGTGSVAEASALAAAGPAARLIGPRMISTDRMASCALAVSLTEGQDP